MPNFKYTPRKNMTFNGVTPIKSEDKPEEVKEIKDIKNDSTKQSEDIKIPIKEIFEETKTQEMPQDTSSKPISSRPMPRPINSVPRSTTPTSFSFMNSTTASEDVKLNSEKEEQPIVKNQPVEKDVGFNLHKEEKVENIFEESISSKIEEKTEIKPDVSISIKGFEEQNQPVEDDFFVMEYSTPTIERKTKKVKEPRQKVKKKSSYKLNKNTLSKIGTLLGIATVIFFVVLISTKIISNNNINYSITNESLRARVVRGIEPGDLIDVQNSLPLQITGKDLIITDKIDGDKIDIVLWDYTNTNMNKLTFLVDGQPIKENVHLKRKPMKITIPRECSLEIVISEEVNSPNTTYAMKVNDNIYFNKISTTRGNTIYFTEGLNNNSSTEITSPSTETPPPTMESVPETTQNTVSNEEEPIMTISE